jgi:hypothetical protein
MRTVLAIQSPRIAVLVAAHWPGCQVQSRHTHDLADFRPFHGGHKGHVRRAEQALHHGVDVPPLLLLELEILSRRNLVRKRLVAAKIRRGRAAAGQRNGGEQQGTT